LGAYYGAVIGPFRSTYYRAAIVPFGGMPGHLGAHHGAVTGAFGGPCHGATMRAFGGIV